MPRTLVWDLPVRVFHWLLAGGFTAAALIAFLTDDEGALFPYHAMIGLTLAFLVVLRIVWGFVGTRHARFSSFLFGPRAVVEYLWGAVSGRGKRFAGHNPGAAYAILAMLGLVLGLAVTGVMMGRGNKSVKEVHELMAWSMLVVVGVHIVGVLLYTLRYHENITRAMIDGYAPADPSQGIRSARPLAAAVLIALTGLWATGLCRSYNAGSRAASFPLLGSLQLGESEHEGGSHGGPTHRRGQDHDD
jgi:cytochrome b